MRELAIVAAVCSVLVVCLGVVVSFNLAPAKSSAVPISITSPPARSELTFWTPADPPKWMASVSSTGEVFIDWRAVEEGVQSEHPRASAAALMMLSIRDKTYKDVSPHE